MITALTEAQIATFPHYVQKWTKIGHDTRPLDPVLVRQSVDKMYECGGLKPPARLILCEGPLQAILAVNMLKYKEEHPQGKKSDKEYKEEVFKHVKEHCEFTTCGYAQHDVGWLAFYDFWRNETDLKGFEILDGQNMMAENCSWYWAFDEVCVVSEKPYICKVNDVNMLHSEDSPAIAYHDGTEIYAWNGVIVDKYVIMNPEKITVKDINDTNNEEQKRVKIDRYGISRYLTDIGATLVDMDSIKVNPMDPESPSMPRCLMRDKEGNQYFVGTDGSTARTYYMNVPNTVKTCVEAHNAIAPSDESNCIAAS